MTSKGKQNVVTIILNELLWCGGEQKTRKQIQDELLAEGNDKSLVDKYLMWLTLHQPKE